MSVRAFELYPAIERIKLMSDKARTEISCIECCGKNLYIGTVDCFVIHYLMEEKMTAEGRIIFNCEKQGHKYLALKKPISQLKAAPALNRIMVLCDGTLTLLNMFDLEPLVSGTKIKGVSAFCLNDNPVQSNPFSVEICVALRKRNIQVYTVTEDRLILVKDMPTLETPVTLTMDRTLICIGFINQYKIVDYETGSVQELFSYDAEQTKPMVLRISREEFLLSAPGALGMFASASGISQRPPLQWSENLASVVYSHPYCLALNDEFITVHSIIDQQQKQSIPFQGGHHLGEFDGKIFVASSSQIYAIVPVAVEKQIQALLADKRVKEAMDLAKNARKIGLGKEKFLKMYQNIQQQAGFIEFMEMRFDETLDLFRDGHLDPREVITIYPHLMPLSSKFTRTVPPLHEIADIQQLSRGDKDKIQQYKTFLLHYLEAVKSTKQALGCQMEIDTALIKLYAELYPGDLQAAIATNTACDSSNCADWLQKCKQYHALGILWSTHSDSDKALDIWTRIAKGELQDPTFPGFDFVVDYLSNTTHYDLIWKYCDWFLDKNQEFAVKIFINRPEQETPSEKLKPETVIDYLSRYNTAVVIYLKHLVFTKKLQKEAYHTHLAVLLLERVLKLLDKNSPDELSKARKDLQELLQSSSLYRVQLLLSKIKDNELYQECAILYGKMEEHDKALRILVHKIRDFSAAENYCLINSRSKDLAQRRRLFHTLLEVYLDPNNERRDSLLAPAVSLLNNNKADFDMVKVLRLIPDHWSIGLLSGFLTSSIRKNIHGHRTANIERMLARGENLQLKNNCLQLVRQSVQLGEDTICAVCSEPFRESTFIRYPNGIVTHTHCAKNKHVCPVTGKMFNLSQQNATSPQKNADSDYR